MADQTTRPGDEDRQPEPAVGGQPSGQSSEVPPDWSAQAEDVTPVAADTYEQFGELGQVLDVTAQGTGSSPMSSRDRKVVVSAAAAVVLIAIGTTLGVALSSSSSVALGSSSKSSGQRFPTTLLGLTRTTNPDAQQSAEQITNEMRGVYKGYIVDPRAAVYGSGPPSQGVAVLTGQWSVAAKAAGFIPHTPSQTTFEVKSYGAADAALYPAGPRGGSLACGDASLDGQSGIICVWNDSKTFGYLLYFGIASSPSDAAAKTIQVRSVVEP